jgi:hypothetical protein
MRKYLHGKKHWERLVKRKLTDAEHGAAAAAALKAEQDGKNWRTKKREGLKAIRRTARNNSSVIDPTRS